jgi:putative NADH-flavin reductase
MRISVIGASGRTGGEVVRQALARGHDVLAVARRPRLVGLDDHPLASSGVGRLTVRQADVVKDEGLEEALEGVDAVVSAVGIGSSRRPTEVYSTGTDNLLRAMSGAGVRRLAVVSAAPVGPRQEQPVVHRYVAMPILERVFGATYADMRRMEVVLSESDLAWTALRPPRLVNRPAVGRYRIDRRPLPRGGTITIPDLATALLACVSSADPGRALYVAN